MKKTGNIYKLTIIIPYYNDEPYTSQLLEVLAPQITDEVEVLVIDDGSRVPFETDWNFVFVTRKENGGVSTARNLGIDKANGEYITFIDADDTIPPYYVSKILEKIDKTHADIIEYSWKTLNGDYVIILENDNSYQVNPAVWCRCFKRSFLGDIRFNEIKDSTEDEDFSRKVGYMEPGNYTHVTIGDFMYYYRDNIVNSKHKRFRKGIMRTKKVVYYFQHVTKEMAWLLDEIKKEDERNEVWLFTKQNDLPELKRYCRVKEPEKTWAHIIRGEPCELITQIKPPLKCQICIYSDRVNMVGGITTFIYNFCKAMHSYYDIMFLYDNIAPEKLKLIRTVARCIKTKDDLNIACDVLMIQRLDDKVPKNVVAKRTVQMIHCLKLDAYHIRDNVTDKVIVSQAAKDSWGEQAKDAVVIHNIADIEKKDSLLLVSATRINAYDKGDHVARMIKLANMLNDKNIPFTWLIFGNKEVSKLPKNMYSMPAIPKVTDVIAKADYLVQLSDESFSYTCLEALTHGTAVIVKGFAALTELGYEDGKMGYILPDNMDFDVTKLTKIPKFTYKYDNDKVINDWRQFLGNMTPTKGFYDGDVMIRVTVPVFSDLKLHKDVHKGDEYAVSRARADELAYDYGFVEVIE